MGKGGRSMDRCWSKATWATQAIHYCLGLVGASLLLLTVAACSNEEQREKSAASASPRSSAPSMDPRADSQPAIVFLGTSLTAGYGLLESESFPALIEARLSDSSGHTYRVVNAGVSGDTSAGGLRRLDWLLRLPMAVLVLELGANDMLRGQSVSQLRSNLEAILEQTRQTHPNVKFLIAGMRAAPNLGPDYVREFDALYPALAKQFDAGLVPFLLEDVAASRSLNQADGIHPTAEGHALIAERVWTHLDDLIR